MLIKTSTIKVFFILSFLFVVGCIGKVQWTERKGGEPEEQNWIPVCPSCSQVVNHEALQCINPKCKTLLTWQDKVVHAQKLYHEEEQEKEGIPAPPALIEDIEKEPLIEKKSEIVKEKIVEKEGKEKPSQNILEDSKKEPQKDPQKEKQESKEEKKDPKEEKQDSKDSKDWEFNEEDWK